MYPVNYVTPSAFLFALAAQAAPAPSCPNSVALNTSLGYGTVTISSVTSNVIRATINNPPINLWDYKLSSDFSSFIDTLAANVNSSTSPKVVILSSSNPNFFIAHYDVHAFSAEHPISAPGNATEMGLQLVRSRTLLATLPVIFVAEINGRASGAGNEIAVQCDIRYAGPSARLSQLEVGFGFLSGAGGLSFLVKLIGRARALEYNLSGRSVDGETAAAIGWVNRAFGREDELRREVDALAERIATFPAQGLAAIKARVNVQKPSDAELEGDLDAFTPLAGTDVVQKAVERYLELSDDQSANRFELGLPGDLEEIVS